MPIILNGEVKMKSIAIYCGSSDYVSEKYLSAARDIGKAVAERGIRIVYGAGSTGMMGAVADAAIEAGGEVFGVIPKIFDTPQLAHSSLTRYEVVPDMHARKAMMIENSDAFIALPGGFGTFEEFFEVLTWAQIGIHAKPIGLLNTDGYYDTLLKFFDEVKERGFTYKEHNNLFQTSADPHKLLELMKSYSPPDNLSKWVER